MVTILVRELVTGADTVDEGKRIGATLEAALKREQLVSLSFSHKIGLIELCDSFSYPQCTCFGSKRVQETSADFERFVADR